MDFLQTAINQTGRIPQVSLVITPLDGEETITITKFLSYEFHSSVLIPVDQFQFTFPMPDTASSIKDLINEGDVAELYASNTRICTGIVDIVSMDTTVEEGDIVTIIGRNLLGQLEDNNAVNQRDNCIWGDNVPLTTTVGSIIQKTRIRGLVAQDAPGGNFYFATEPGESKLSALARYVEPLNCIFWGDPNGYLVVGKPTMSVAAGIDGFFQCDRSNRASNVNGIKVVYSSTQIPNTVLSVWSGQENVQSAIQQSQIFSNSADGPARLLAFGHYVQKCVVTSTPQGSSPTSLSDANALNSGVNGGNILTAYAMREIARANVNEVQVQVNVKSHFNSNGLPFTIDSLYQVDYPRGGIQETMYVHGVDYHCDAKNGPMTQVHLCRLGSIVAGVSKNPVNATITNSSLLPTL